MELKLLNNDPQIILKKSFLNEEEISFLLQKNNFSKSTIIKNNVISLSEKRTSETYMDINRDFNFIKKKIFKFLIPIGFNYSLRNYENIQLIKYEINQEFASHDDFLGEENDRVGTIIIYLKKSKKGGKTIFSKLGIEIDADPGDLLFFSYDTPLKNLTTHAGEKVLEGTKIIASMFIRKEVI